MIKADIKISGREETREASLNAYKTNYSFGIRLEDIPTTRAIIYLEGISSFIDSETTSITLTLDSGEMEDLLKTLLRYKVASMEAMIGEGVFSNENSARALIEDYRSLI